LLSVRLVYERPSVPLSCENVHRVSHIVGL
jgi:hypothetical protein